MKAYLYSVVLILFHLIVSSKCQNLTIPVPKFSHDVRFCGLPNDPNYNYSYLDGSDQCDFPAYGKSLLKMAIPAIIMAVFAILGSLVLIIFICCPICKGYKRNKIIMFIILGVALGFTIIGLIVTQTGNVYISRSVSTLGDTASDVISHSISILNNVTEEIQTLPLFNEDFQESLEDTKSVFVEFNETTHKTVDKIKYYDDLRRAAIYVGSIVPSVLIIAGLVMMLISIRFPLGLIGWLCLFLSLFVWLSLAVHLVTAKVISDVCWEIDLSIENGQAGPLTLIVECNSENGIIGNLRNELYTVLDEAVTEACNAINDACDTLTCEDYTCNDIDDIRNSLEITINDGGVERTVRECAEECTIPALRDSAVEVVEAVDTFVEYHDIALTIINYIDCQFIVDAFYDSKDSICDKLVFGMQQIFAGNGLIGIGMVIGCFCLVHIFKGTKSLDKNEFD